VSDSYCYAAGSAVFQNRSLRPSVIMPMTIDPSFRMIIGNDAEDLVGLFARLT